jgi:hypothetical protein
MLKLTSFWTCSEIRVDRREIVAGWHSWWGLGTTILLRNGHRFRIANHLIECLPLAGWPEP